MGERMFTFQKVGNMNILWISFLGSWTLPLLNSIRHGNRVAIIIPVSEKSKARTEIKSGITFFYLYFKSKELNQPMTLACYNKYASVIEYFQPDVIHVHGTEKNLAQIQNFCKTVPIVISIQGILYAYKPYSYNFLDKKLVSNCRTLKNILGYGGVSLMHGIFRKGERYERDIFSNGRYFIGRTDWDKAHVMFSNSKARYFKGEEMLRSEFYDNAASWNIEKCNRHTIFMPSGFNPIKGMHIAVETVYLLKKYYSDVKLVIPGLFDDIFKRQRATNIVFGEEYIRYVKQRIVALDLCENIKFLPRLDSKGMIREMQSANVFLSPSSIDNSPNAVGEAMMVGVPLVTTPVGGELSFLTDNKTTLFAPAGDSYMMAFQIKRVFDDDALAMMLSENAHQVALKRHDRNMITQQYIGIYHDVINDLKRLV